MRSSVELSVARIFLDAHGGDDADLVALDRDGGGDDDVGVHVIDLAQYRRCVRIGTSAKDDAVNRGQ